ncbi:VanZ family protein [Undibacterium sp. Jales W-56]|nr:VanZ family protein [Undibacterium sp. Jales W-56]
MPMEEPNTIHSPEASLDDLLAERPASPFARAALLAYVFLIVYASLYPFSGWQNDNLAALSDLIRQWPRYWTAFDALTNVLGYIPLGMLIVFALYPVCRRSFSVAIASVAGALLSASMEITQYFLPSRVTSLLDFLTNAGGALIGALIGALMIPLLLEKGRLRLLRKRWLYNEATREILVLGLWPMAQIYPQAYLFGLGQILPILSFWINDFFDISIDLGSFLINDMDLSPEQFLLAETIITACGCTGAVLISLSILSRHAPKVRLAGLLLAAAICAKALASAILFKPEFAFSWLTPGAQGGLVIALIMLYGFSFAPHHVQRRLAILMLSISLIVVNLIPINPYFIVTLQTWVQGKFLNFNGAAQFLSLLWPFLMLWILLNKKLPDRK